MAFNLGSELREELGITGTNETLNDAMLLAARLSPALTLEATADTFRVAGGGCDQTVPRPSHLGEAVEARVLAGMLGARLAVIGGIAPAGQECPHSVSQAFVDGLFGLFHRTHIALVRRLSSHPHTTLLFRARHVEVAAVLKRAFGLDHVPNFAEASELAKAWEKTMVRRSPVDELLVHEYGGWLFLMYPERDWPDPERTGRTSIEHAMLKARNERRLCKVHGLAKPADTWRLYQSVAHRVQLHRADVDAGICKHWQNGPKDLILPHSFPTPEAEAAELALLLGKVLLGGPEHGFTCDPNDPDYHAACEEEQAVAEVFAWQWLTGAQI